MTFKEFQKLKKQYMKTEAVRLLIKENSNDRIPTLEERVGHAFEKGFAAALVYAMEKLK